MELFIIFVVLQLVDIYTTHKAISSGVGTEGNKVMKWFFDRWGVLPSLLVIKAFTCVFLWYNLAGVPVELFIILNCFYVWVVYNNIKVIRGK